MVDVHVCTKGDITIGQSYLNWNMKQFIQLEIKKDPKGLMDLLDKMIKNPTDDFKYDQSRSDSAKQGAIDTGLSGIEYAVFSSNKEQLFYSNVFVSVNGDELRVSNICSEDSRFHDLGITRYNLVLEQFFHHFMARFLDSSYSGCVQVSGDEMSMEKMLGTRVYSALHAWESACNKENPTLNAYDEERWFEFVSKLYESGKKLDSSDFGQWLSEDCRWPPLLNDVIFDLEIKLEYSISLLKYYGRRCNK